MQLSRPSLYKLSLVINDLDISYFYDTHKALVCFYFIHGANLFLIAGINHGTTLD